MTSALGGRRELLDEERIAAAPLHHVVDGGRRRGDPGKLPHQDEDVMPVQAPEIQPDDPRIPLELGNEREGPDRADPAHPVRSVASSSDRRLAQVAREEPEEPAGPVVGPLDVLDHEHHGPVASLAFDHAQHGLEEPRLSLAIELVIRVAIVARPRRHLGEQARDLVPRRPEQGGEQAGLDRPGQLAERLDERRIRDGATSRGQARPAEHGGPAFPGRGDDTPDQPGLPDPCLAADDDRGPATGDGRFQRGVKARFLGAATDEGSPIATIDHSPPMIATGVAAASRADERLIRPAPSPGPSPGATHQRARGDLGSADGAGDLRAAIAVRGQDERLTIDDTELHRGRRRRPRCSSPATVTLSGEGAQSETTSSERRRSATEILRPRLIARLWPTRWSQPPMSSGSRPARTSRISRSNASWVRSSAAATSLVRLVRYRRSEPL